MITSKELLGLILPLHEARIDDLDSTGQELRLIHSRIETLGSVIEILAGSARERFELDADTSETIERALEANKKIGAEISKRMSKDESRRDQIHALVAEMKAIVAGESKPSGEG